MEIIFVKIGVVDSHSSMNQLQQGPRHVDTIQEDMNLVPSMACGLNVGRVVVSLGLHLVVRSITTKEYQRKIIIYSV